MNKELEAFENIMKIYGETNSLEGTYDDFLTIKRALQRLEQIDNANPSEALKCLTGLENTIIQRDGYINYFLKIKFDNIKQALIKAEKDKKKAEALKELITNHIELVIEEDRCYFKIKNSKGNEKSFTSYTMLDFWKEVLNNE